MDEPVNLLMHHTHTQYSDAAEEDLEDFESINHYIDYIDIVENLPNGFNIVFTRTDHFKTDPELFKDLEKQVERLEGEVRRFNQEGIFYGKLDKAEFAVINGVEASYTKESSHLTILGLPLEDRDLYHNLSQQDILEILQSKAELAVLAHPFAPRNSISKKGKRDLLELNQSLDKKRVGVGYTTGYTGLLNKLARGELTPENNVETLANQHDTFLVPELDSHVLLPDNGQGFGVMNQDIFNEIRDGEFPLKNFQNSKIIYKSSRNSLSMIEFLKSFPDIAPGYENGFYRKLNNLTGRIILPYNDREFKKLRNTSMENIACLDVDTVRKDIQALN